MVLPLVKLGTLALRSISKPIANKVKKQAGLHPEFRDFIITIAQANHRLTTTVQRRIYGRATDVAIRPLSEKRAVQAAAELVGETFLLLVVGAAFIFESRRNAKKEESTKLQLEEVKKTNEELVKLEEFYKQRCEEVSTRVDLLKQVAGLHRQRREELAGQAELLMQLADFHKEQREELAIEFDFLKGRVVDLEKLANPRGLFCVFNKRKSETERIAAESD